MYPEADLPINRQGRTQTSLATYPRPYPPPPERGYSLNRPRCRGGPWIRPRSASALFSGSRKEPWCGGVWSSGAAPVSFVLRDGDAPWTGEGRGRRDVFRLSCLRRLQACPSGDGTGRMPENGPLPASPEPSKEGQNAPRGASVPAPKRTIGALNTPRSSGRRPGAPPPPRIAPARWAWRVLARPIISTRRGRGLVSHSDRSRGLSKRGSVRTTRSFDRR